MTTTAYASSAVTSMQQKAQDLRRPAAILLILEFLLIFPPLIILGAAINWPANLNEPASVNLPPLLEQSMAITAGYGIYLIYSLLFWPVAYLTGRVIVGADVENPTFRIASGFAALSALARALGIVRWLFAMPVLARLYVSGTPELQQTVSVVYEAMNALEGGVGELLGVSLFAVIWLVLISVLILRSSAWPAWLGYFGLVAAASLFLNLLEVVGIDMGAMVTISVTLLQFWMLAAAVVFLRRPAVR